MSPAIRHKYKYFHSTVQRAKDRRQKFHFCRLPFDVRLRNIKLDISVIKSFATVQPLLQDFDRCKVKLQVMKLIYGK